VYETEGFASSSSPPRRSSRSRNSTSQPARHRKFGVGASGARIEDLRAIPWVFSGLVPCATARLYGFGSGVQAYLDAQRNAREKRGKRAALRDMFAPWPFFRA